MPEKENFPADGECRITDSHFHCEIMAERGLDTRPSLSMLAGGIDIGCSCSDLPRRAPLLEEYPRILMAGGMGPWETETSETPEGPGEGTAVPKTEEQLDAELAVLEENVVRYKARFIGETGLDYYWNYGTVQLQKYLFISQIKLAGRLGMKVLVHNREADADTAQIIKQYGPSEGGVIHCFSGSTELMRTALDAGYYISYAGNVTYKANSALRSTLEFVPRDRLLLETDAPYLTPVPLRGKPNVPEYIVHTYACAAECLGLSTEALAEQVYSNFLAFCR